MVVPSRARTAKGENKSSGELTGLVEFPATLMIPSFVCRAVSVDARVAMRDGRGDKMPEVGWTSGYGGIEKGKDGKTTICTTVTGR